MSVHLEVLTPDQQVVLKASAQAAQKWEAYLAGGAGLALQLGHRRSVDFDWFTRRTLAPADVLRDLQSFGEELVGISSGEDLVGGARPRWQTASEKRAFVGVPRHQVRPARTRSNKHPGRPN